MRIIAVALLLTACIHTAPEPEACEGNAALQRLKSAELARLETEDQADRAFPFEKIDWSLVSPRDLHRRIQVADLFATGCLSTAADYANAAMIYQHGNTTDHYYQAFLWAHEAVKLGDNNSRWLTAAGIDRYLVKTGHQQLFGTQFSQDAAKHWCIQPVAAEFPETRRMEYVKRSLSASITNFLQGMKSPLTLKDIKYCEPALKPTPTGTVPGFW
jgi:hypothetical protein